MRVLAFLFSTFLSALGDTMLVFSIPAGLGLEGGDIRMAIFMWFIPAIAMYSSSFFYKFIGQRVAHARKDYALLLLGLAIIEILTAILTLKFSSIKETLILSCVFVYFYAFAKEGIPKIFYDVQVYRFFVNDEGYARLAGQSNALTILARIAGGVAASFLIFKSSWKMAFFIDAVSFLVLALAIIIWGRDLSNEQSKDTFSSSEEVPRQDAHINERMGLVRSLNFIVPMLFAFNALAWNYITLISEKLGVSDVSSSILIVTLLQIPGMILGLQFEKYVTPRFLRHFIVTLPILFFCSVVLFLLLPSKALLLLATLLMGLVSGLLWPAERYVKKFLPHEALIQTNNIILKRLSFYQFVACILAFAIFSFQQFTWPIIFSSIGLGVVVHFTNSRSLVVFKQFGVIASIGFLFLLGSCKIEESEKRKVVVLPSISQDLRISPNLTYSAMAIINDTSAHLARVSKKLALEGEVLKNYKSMENGKAYILNLQDDYRSARGEEITAEDVEYSIKWYLLNQKGLAAQYTNIKGAAGCVPANCEIEGIKKNSPFQIEIHLENVDLNFIDALTSPWVILFKKNRPHFETIGTCQIPYQTGKALVKNCTDKFIEMEYGGTSIFVFDQSGYEGHKLDTDQVASLLTNSPDKKQYASLTVMSAFANPDSKILNPKQRADVLSNIRFFSKELSQAVGLSFSPTLTPKWLSMKVPEKLEKIESRKVSCPKEAIKILLDTSLPDHEVLKKYFRMAIPCDIEFNVTTADQYFENFSKNDMGVAWFTPDFLNVYNIFGIFDCEKGMCYFNWKDNDLQTMVNLVRSSVEQGSNNLEIGSQIESYLYEKGYAAPIADMNWWIKKEKGIDVIHQAGLFQIKIGDFL